MGGRRASYRRRRLGSMFLDEHAFTGLQWPTTSTPVIHATSSGAVTVTTSEPAATFRTPS
jgi:hypothetical protein